MALPAHHYQFQPLPADSSEAQKIFAFEEENAASLLDPALLEPDMISTPMVAAAYRKDSFVNADGIMSPADSHTHAWDNRQYHDLPRSAPFKAEDGHFRPPMPPHIDHHGLTTQWPMSTNSGSVTPNAGLDMMLPAAHPLDHMPFMHHNQETPYDRRQQQQQQQIRAADPRYLSAPHVHTPISAAHPTDWMALAEAEGSHRALPKRLRSNSPGRSAFDSSARDAGVTKKNKRIDIPLERNLQNIDHLIETTKDEEVLKELKAQKRLLRNREAALASRQRKKKHTEELENKEKGHQTQVQLLEQQLDVVVNERAELDQQRQILMHRNDELQRFIEVLQMERRDMMMKHNEETASLRRKVQVLTEQIENGPPTMSAAPSSTGFNDFNAEMEALNMDHEWDHFLFMPDKHDSSADVDISTPTTELVKPIALEQTPTQPPSKTSDQPIATGLLFMLLLCGALVATKPAISTLEVDIPADVRAVAPTVLSNLLAESGGVGTQAQLKAPVARPQHPVVQSFTRGSANRMDHVHRSLIAPTKQQTRDAAFALTASQYASLTSNPDLPPTRPSDEPRRTLAQALSESQAKAPESKAEIYTKSLLWEQIPADVVNRFKDLVRDHHIMSVHHEGQE